MSEYFILPKVSTHLLLREGGDVPGHLRHLSGVSPQLQVLAMGFSSALYVCQKMVESCVRAHGFSPDTLLMDRQRARAMTRGSICFGVYVDGVCADMSRHESGILSLEDSCIWRLRHGLEFAACQKQLTGDQVAKLIGHITWSCLLRRPALSLINAGYRYARTFGPGSGRLWSAVAQEFKWIASLLPLLTCSLASPWSPWVYATDASGGTHVPLSYASLV